jgi:hypothetical protein
MPDEFASGYALVLRAQFFAPLPAPRIEHFAAAFGRHAGAKAVTALAHQFARLIGPFHGKLRYINIGAAYTEPLPARQTELTGNRASFRDSLTTSIE